MCSRTCQRCSFFDSCDPGLCEQALSAGTCTVTARVPDAWTAAIAVKVARIGVGWHLTLSPAFTFHNYTAEKLHILLTGGTLFLSMPCISAACKNTFSSLEPRQE